MPGATPVYGLPYPIGTDRLDDAVTTIPEDLALQLESTLQGFGGIAAPGSWAAPSLASGWASYGSDYQAVQYRKVGAAVYLRGLLVRSGSTYTANTVVFTLPVGFRPSAINYFFADAGGAHGPIGVRANGEVIVGVSVSVGATVWLTSPPIWLD
jgi:hypothetical protein